MTLIPGQDGDIILIHEDVNSGNGYAFLLAEIEIFVPPPLGEPLGKNSAQTRTLSVSEKPGWIIEQDVVHFFSISFAKSQTNPNGQNRDISENQDKQNLLEILSKLFEITLVTRFGAFSGLKADGHALTMTQYLTSTIAAVRLLNTNRNFAPADYDTWLLSKVVDEDDLPAEYGKVFDEDSPTIKGYVRS